MGNEVGSDVVGEKKGPRGRKAGNGLLASSKGGGGDSRDDLLLSKGKILQKDGTRKPARNCTIKNMFFSSGGEE